MEKEKISLHNIDYIANIGLLAKQVVEGSLLGIHKSPFHGFSVEFSEHRVYNHGDSLKNIDWKVFAKTDKLYTKKHEEETNLRCQILIDTSSSMYYPYQTSKNKLYYASILAGTCIHLLKKQRDAFGLTLFDSDIRVHTSCKTSLAHEQLLYTYINKSLEEKNSQKQTHLSHTLHRIAERIHKRSLVILFSDMLAHMDKESVQDIFDALLHIKHYKNEVIIFHTIDKATEVDFDFDNRPHQFIDLESGKELRIEPSEWKNQYRKNFKELLSDMIEKSRQYRIDWVEADMNQPFDKVLESYFLKRKKVY